MKLADNTTTIDQSTFNIHSNEKYNLIETKFYAVKDTIELFSIIAFHGSDLNLINFLEYFARQITFEGISD